MYKLEVWFQAYSSLLTNFVYTNATLGFHLRTNTAVSNLDAPHYRWTWLKRAVQNGTASDYTSVSNLVAAFTNSPGTSNYLFAVTNLVNVEQWMRVIALRHIACDADGYGLGAGHNMYAYTPQASQWLLQSVDFDYAYTASGYKPSTSLINGWACDPNITTLINTAPF